MAEQPAGLTEVVVGRIGRAHGIRGEVSVELRTDEPERRFAVGSVLRTPVKGRALTVAAVRPHGGRLLVTFAEAGDRTAAEALRGTTLVVDVDGSERPDDPDEFYDHQLIGLRVRTTDGQVVGTVVELRHLPAQDLLEVRRDDDDDTDPVLVPFVRELVPEIDLDAGWLVVAALPGLLDTTDEPEQD